MADRQDQIPGFSTEVFQRREASLIGAGGLISYVAPALCRKGIGRIVICDDDVVEMSNLNRQWFFPRDLHRPKALCLAKNAADHGCLGSKATGHQVAFSDDVAMELCGNADVVVCGVDNDRTRADASRFCRRLGLVCIFCAINEQADYGWVYTQHPDGACVGCVFPRIAQAASTKRACRAVPAVLDILQVIGGIVLVSIDAVLMERQRYCTFQDFDLTGSRPSVVDTVARNVSCALCNN